MSWENNRVLITGISGFAGSYLAKHLLDEGAEVYGLIVRKSDQAKPKNLVERGIVDDVKLIEGNVEHISSIGSALDFSEPEVVFHLAAQSYVPRSFTYPLETAKTNSIGTANLLEAIRMKELDPRIVFAGTSEEYGLVFSSEEQYKRSIEKYGTMFPEPEKIPELPINEKNHLRPMSPYAVSKVYGDYLMRNYYHSYGLKTVISRAFNHEGAGRGLMFVTSVITNQIMRLKIGETDEIKIGNVNAFRDWSHIKDIVKGYCLLAEEGSSGEVYNQGSQRTNSVLTYILMSLEEVGFKIHKIKTFSGDKTIENPINNDNSEIFGLKFNKTLVDTSLLRGEIELNIADKGIFVYTDKGKVSIVFDKERFRPAEVPILLSDTEKIRKLGYNIKYNLRDIIKDQLNYFL